MVQINFATREVNCKIVFYGPGRCGKTTNLQVVHAKAPANSTGELVSIATETDRTLYFDFLPLDLGTVAGMRTKFQLYTVPGQVYYDATRKLVLQGCDGIVFVADSNPDMINENIESLDNLAKNLKENGLDINDIPLVLQWNKRDLPNAVPAEELNAKMNRNNWPTVEAVAVNGDGVFQTLKAISQQVIRKLNREQGYSEDGAKRGGAPARTSAMARPAAPPPPAVPAPPPPPPPPRPAAPPPPAPAPVAVAPAPAPPPPPPRPAAPAPAPAPPPPPMTESAPAELPQQATMKMNPVSLEIARRRQAEAAAQQHASAPPEEAAASTEEAAPEAVEFGGGGKTGLIVVIVVLLLAAGAAAAYFGGFIKF